MTKRKIVAFAVTLMLAMGICPALAFAAGSDDLQPGTTDMTAQADDKDLSNCSVRFTDAQHKGSADDWWQLYYAKGKDVGVEPQFDLYLNGAKVPTSAYTVSYEMTYWSEIDDEDVYENWNDVLKPSGSPESGEESMSTEYAIVATAKAGSGYTGTYKRKAIVCVADYYNVGRFMDAYIAKAKWKYNINPMNGNYYVIPQKNAKAILGSLTLRAGCDPDDGGMKHDGDKVDSKYYTVTYYAAKKNAVTKNLSPASRAKTGKPLNAMPTTPGSYVMIIKGNEPFYGTASIYFDIQGSMNDVKVSNIKTQNENGKELTPKFTVKYKGTVLKEGVDYDVTYKNNLKAGTATAVITGSQVINNNNGSVEEVNKARYFTGSKTIKFRIKKNPNHTWIDNPMTASAKTITVKAKKLKKGNITFNQNKAFSVANAQGKVTYTEISGTSLVSVAKKTGKVTILKHAQHFRGTTYRIKVRIAAAGNSEYYAKSKVVKLVVKFT